MVPNTCESPYQIIVGGAGERDCQIGFQKPLNSKCVAPSIIHHKFVFKLPELTIFCQTCVIRPQDSGVSCVPYDRFPGCTQIIPGEPLPVDQEIASRVQLFFFRFFCCCYPFMLISQIQTMGHAALLLWAPAHTGALQVGGGGPLILMPWVTNHQLCHVLPPRFFFRLSDPRGYNQARV